MSFSCSTLRGCTCEYGRVIVASRVISNQSATVIWRSLVFVVEKLYTSQRDARGWSLLHPALAHPTPTQLQVQPLTLCVHCDVIGNASDVTHLHVVLHPILVLFQEAELLQTISDRLATPPTAERTVTSQDSPLVSRTAQDLTSPASDVTPDVSDAHVHAVSVLPCAECSASQQDLHEATLTMVQRLDRAQSRLHRTLREQTDVVTSSPTAASSRLPLPTSVTSQATSARKPPNGLRHSSVSHESTSSARVKGRDRVSSRSDVTGRSSSGSTARALLLASRR